MRRGAVWQSAADPAKAAGGPFGNFWELRELRRDQAVAGRMRYGRGPASRGGLYHGPSTRLRADHILLQIVLSSNIQLLSTISFDPRSESGAMNSFLPSGEYDWNVSSSFGQIYPLNPHFENQPSVESAPFSADPAHESLRNAALAGPRGLNKFDGAQNLEQSLEGLSGDSITVQQNLAASSTAPRRRPARRSKYHDLDWDEYKAKIKELYLEDDRPLRETIRIMKDTFSFDAS